MSKIEIKNIVAVAEGREILQDFFATFDSEKTYAILGDLLLVKKI